MRTPDKKADWQYDKEQNKMLLGILGAVNEIFGVDSENIELLKGKETNLDRWQYSKERNFLLGKLRDAVCGYKDLFPPVPPEEGEYTLKASVSAGGEIAYSWVMDEAEEQD